VLLESEVAPVIDALQRGGIEQTARGLRAALDEVDVKRD